MRKLADRVAILAVLVAPTIAAAAWTSHEALRAAWAVFDYAPVPLTSEDWHDPTRILEMRRQVQRHFLDHSVYIPMEDIVAGAPTEEDPTDMSLLMQKACGQGRLFIWIPFKFFLPVTGEKVIEWCWRPQTSDV